MAFFQKKEKWSAQQFAKALSAIFWKNILKSYKENDPSWSFFRETFDSMDETALLKEWIAFELFITFRAVMSYFRPDVGIIIKDEFNKFCSDTFTQLGLPDNEAQFRMFRGSRFSWYSDAKKYKDKGESIHYLAKTFCRFCEQEMDIAATLPIAEYYVNSMTAEMGLLRKLTERIKVVY